MLMNYGRREEDVKVMPRSRRSQDKKTAKSWRTDGETSRFLQRSLTLLASMHQ
jgi:hypothetical protein